MSDVRAGFIALCRNEHDFPDFVNYHCIIHQQALAGKVVNFSQVMTLVLKLINSIRAKALQPCLFKADDHRYWMSSTPRTETYSSTLISGG